ncbi:hypothetical protein AAFF_G00269200 [Aldrovandia affinis]|uniref:Uncharacterized protein n=1 Tax=Aldrovandia affinis TaxID=143900 RepID=A0AAD7WSK1_9TELE|nr:hypothetical protein AAFF_G00269200 [Aldrovandia affinis]
MINCSCSGKRRHSAWQTETSRSNQLGERDASSRHLYRGRCGARVAQSWSGAQPVSERADQRDSAAAGRDDVGPSCRGPRAPPRPLLAGDLSALTSPPAALTKCPVYINLLL